MIGTRAHRNYPISSNAEKFYFSPKKYFIERKIQTQFVSGYGLTLPRASSKYSIGILHIFNKISWNKDDILDSCPFKNLLLNLYIKATGVPWIVNQDKSSLLHIFLGIKVYKVMEGYGEGLAVAIDDTGSIINVQAVPAVSTYRRSYHIERNEMKDIILKAVKTYEQQERKKPDKLWLGILKFNRFHAEELEGIIGAINSIMGKYSEVKVAPIAVMKSRLYPKPSGTGNTYIGIASNACIIGRRPGINPTVAYIDYRIKDYSVEWSVKQLVNCLEALYKAHWQTFWGTQIRFPPIMKFAENISNLRRRGVTIPDDRTFLLTPWFV